MRLWQRIGFSVLSLILGWFSFDFALLALRDIRSIAEKGSAETLSRFFTGCMILILWLLFLVLYFWILRKLSGNLNIVEYEKAEEKPRFRSKWFDILLQGGILATGFFLRFFFIMVIYLPRIAA